MTSITDDNTPQIVPYASDRLITLLRARVILHISKV